MATGYKEPMLDKSYRNIVFSDTKIWSAEMFLTRNHNSDLDFTDLTVNLFYQLNHTRVLYVVTALTCSVGI